MAKKSIKTEEDRAKSFNRDVNKEEKRLLESLKNLPGLYLTVNRELIRNAAFQSVMLKQLRENIKENGVKEQYKNGENQYGFKDSTEVKTYINMSKTYQGYIKQLNDLLKENKLATIPNEQDPF